MRICYAVVDEIQKSPVSSLHSYSSAGLSDPAAVRAEEHDFQPVHWAYSSVFGTGWYQLDGNRSVFVLRMPPRQTLRQSSITDSGDSAWIYYAGIKSRYTFPGRKFDWSVLNSIYYAGYTPNSGRAESLAAAQLGVGFRRPLNNATLLGRALDLNWHVIYSFLGEAIDFGLPDGKFEPVKDQFEIGVAVSFRDRPYEFWIF